MICAIKSRHLAHGDSSGALITLKREKCCNNQNGESERCKLLSVERANRGTFTDLDLLLEEVDFVLLLQKLLLLSCNLVGKKNKDVK